ncbi:hypothetical protein SAMN02745248_01225 [Hathewaya proteolytica DSM 3090]|uniref:Uncharacterized protein n=1 Tax=Hathewaya proteolytica DSM 3090 TaxID=1121331 RepID=A0A1M6N1R8_9CLOT|nr:hypothetical protein [Hathewaya proteolytica]SHJ89634.1 hypothetical protein SAMN02745248_01225 [Hathewaya proteolytica DSM 3090]
MITKFMRDTPLAAIEIEMQLIPGFTPRACGTFRSQQRYVNPNNPNPILYEESLGLFLKEIEIQAFALRVQRIIEAASNLGESEVNQMLFRNAEHKKRFQSICKSGLFPKLEESYGYAAAIFLLSEDAFVWSKTKSCLDSQLIHFEAICIHGVDLDGYAIFHMAKELYSGKPHITVSELSDPELINDRLLRLIVNAFLVRRYGINVIKGGR